MPYPVALFDDEKCFLEDMFARIPRLRERFNDAVNTYPPERMDEMPHWLRGLQRGVWAEMNIPDEQAGTLADHVALMGTLALAHSPSCDLPYVFDLILARAYPKAISGDYLFSRYISKTEAAQLDELALRVLYDREPSHRYRDLFERMAEPQTNEELWVHDLDLLATCKKGLEFIATNPAAIHALCKKVERHLATDRGRAVFKIIMGGQRLTNTPRTATHPAL